MLKKYRIKGIIIRLLSYEKLTVPVIVKNGTVKIKERS